MDFLKSPEINNLNDDEIFDLLYAIGRDNEGENLSEQVAENLDLLFKISKFSVASSEDDAKWQLANRLGEVTERLKEAEEILFLLIEDKDEYVNRMALLSLGRIKSSKTEYLAEKAWSKDEEYQKIAALWALKYVNSKLLPKYIQKALEDGRKSIVENAEEVKNG